MSILSDLLCQCPADDHILRNGGLSVCLLLWKQWGGIYPSNQAVSEWIISQSDAGDANRDQSTADGSQNVTRLEISKYSNMCREAMIQRISRSCTCCHWWWFQESFQVCLWFLNVSGRSWVVIFVIFSAVDVYKSVLLRRSLSAPHLRHRGTLELRRSQCHWFPVSPYLNDPTLSMTALLNANSIGTMWIMSLMSFILEMLAWKQHVEKKDGQLAASQNIQLCKCFIHQWLW